MILDQIVAHKKEELQFDQVQVSGNELFLFLMKFFGHFLQNPQGILGKNLTKMLA